MEILMQEKRRMDEEIEKIGDKNKRAEKAYLEARKYFAKWDHELDHSTTGVKFLSNPRVADMVAESLHYRDGKVYELIAYCIMPNHEHVVFTPLKEEREKYYSLSKIMHSLKRHTANEANLILDREGEFWQHENYDHFARDERELERIVKYVLYNPVKSGLVENWRGWKWSYSKYDV
jgi:REP element-mobilizing transposase RayT